MVRDYKQSDYNTIARWYESHNQPVPPEDLLPPLGIIDPNVACGFMILCDCNLAILEFYITNPESPKDVRDRVLDQITEDLIKYGKAIGIDHFKADTQIPAVRTRAEKHGFKYIGEFSGLFLRKD